MIFKEAEVKQPWKSTRQSTPIFLPRESHGQRSLAGYGPQGHKGSDTTEATEHTHTHAQSQGEFLKHCGSIWGCSRHMAVS